MHVLKRKKKRQTGLELSYIFFELCVNAHGHKKKIIRRKNAQQTTKERCLAYKLVQTKRFPGR